ncbi:hypothetical protein GCM10010832_10710 [Psychroflexus planctonicus]|uniref:SGNH/GDSL hydrolase family protein n=2 Tax=Psychroflexus planctonicus TaxID=1526575 RepID=A0ABQ1SGF6_9FLAO|nr:hypothetical protein GCM10010832_10710 [Psychroflexus planctonicus]
MGLFYCSGIFILEHYLPSFLRPNISFKMGAYGHLHSRIKEVNDFKNVDILFLGSSHTYRGFDTRIFSKNGYHTFNLGSSSQTPLQTNILLNRYLNQLAPKLIVYEVYPGTFMSDGVESSLDLLSNDKNDLDSFKMAFKTKNIKVLNTFIYASIRDMLNLNTNYTEQNNKGVDTYIPGGYVEKEISYYTPKFIDKSEIVLRDNQLDNFEENIQKINNKNIDLMLVYAPISKSKYKSFNNKNHFDSLMHEHGKYYNFNEILSLNDSLHFYDSHHLNQKGVKKFNKKLIEILQNESQL